MVNPNLNNMNGKLTHDLYKSDIEPSFICGLFSAPADLLRKKKTGNAKQTKQTVSQRETSSIFEGAPPCLPNYNI